MSFVMILFIISNYNVTIKVNFFHEPISSYSGLICAQNVS